MFPENPLLGHLFFQAARKIIFRLEKISKNFYAKVNVLMPKPEKISKFRLDRKPQKTLEKIKKVRYSRYDVRRMIYDVRSQT